MLKKHLLAAFLALAFTAIAARAQVKIDSELNVTGLPAGHCLIYSGEITPGSYFAISAPRERGENWYKEWHSYFGVVGKSLKKVTVREVTRLRGDGGTTTVPTSRGTFNFPADSSEPPTFEKRRLRRSREWYCE